MPLVIEPRQAIRSYPTGNIEPAKTEAAQLVENELTYAKLWARQNTTVVEGKLARIDVQKDLPQGGKNIQVQLNDKRRTMTVGTTIAQLTIDAAARDSGADTPDNVRYQNELLTQAKRALKESLKSKMEYRIVRKP
jgi:hypothetical protein